ncbi:MAG: hypothetical protein H7Y61_08145 [Rhizobiales bacterium]|nr:hypothetical protein [Rhizobacter sp.]
MTTATLHANVQRNRFAQHALALLARLTSGASPLSAAQAAAAEAQNVRNLAHSYAKTDPGFAADLYAAAARHEGLHAD